MLRILKIEEIPSDIRRFREKRHKGTSAETGSLQTVSDFHQKEADSYRHSTNPENKPGKAKREPRDDEKGEEQNP